MIRSKKGVELTFNVIIIAIISLLVLVVIIAIFRGQISDIASGFTRIRERETNQSVLEGVFGCTENALDCRGNDLYECENGAWVKQRTCSDGCKNGACV